MNLITIQWMACSVAVLILLCTSDAGYPATTFSPDEFAIRDAGELYGGEKEEFWESDTLMINGKVYYREKLGLKSPSAAIFLALVPGFIIHGLGHYYAGYPRTGNVLLITEGSSFVFFFLAFGLALDDSDSIDTAGVLAVGAFFGFLGSWAYDIIGAPLVIRKNNKKVLENLSVHPWYLPSGKDSGRFGIQLRFRY